MKKPISIILCLGMVIAVGSIASGCGNGEVLQRLDGFNLEGIIVKIMKRANVIKIEAAWAITSGSKAVRGGVARAFG